MIRFESMLSPAQRELVRRLIASNGLPPDPLYPHEWMKMKTVKQTTFPVGMTQWGEHPEGAWWCEESASIKPDLWERSGGPVDKAKGQRWTYNPRKSG